MFKLKSKRKFVVVQLIERLLIFIRNIIKIIDEYLNSKVSKKYIYENCFNL